MNSILLSLIYLSHIVLMYCTLSITLRAQDFEQENAKIMERMDTESFKGKDLLNKATALDYQLEPEKQGASMSAFITLKINHETTKTTTTPGIDSPSITGCFMQGKTANVTDHCDWEDY